METMIQLRDNWKRLAIKLTYSLVPLITIFSFTLVPSYLLIYNTSNLLIDALCFTSVYCVMCVILVHKWIRFEQYLFVLGIMTPLLVLSNHLRVVVTMSTFSPRKKSRKGPLHPLPVSSLWFGAPLKPSAQVKCLWSEHSSS